MNDSPCIRTFSGKLVNVFDPDPDNILIEDIAHSLSMQCRFAGHINRHYSVAQHSLNCSFLIEDELKLDALMHDAAEAYITDLPRPIKKSIPQFSEIEEYLQMIICEKFNLVHPLPQRIHDVDDQMLQLEWDNMVLRLTNMNFGSIYPFEVERNFLKMFNEYKIRR